MAHALGVDRLYLYLNMDRPVTIAERAEYRAAVLRRARREPTSLITGTKEFWSFPFKVAPGALIPRPDTETLVECVVTHMAGSDAPRVLELGVGVGAVSISLLRENPQAAAVGTDISMTALRLTRGKRRTRRRVRALVAPRLRPVRRAAARPAFRCRLLQSALYPHPGDRNVGA